MHIFLASLGPEIVGDVPDEAVLKEVEECEAQCMEIYGILNELKTRVGELLSVNEFTMYL